jgi:hypothetical protein
METTNKNEEAQPLKITDRIKSLQDALDYNGETRAQFDLRTQYDTPGQKAGKALEAVALALNEGKRLTKEDRWYYPWLERGASGVGLSFGVFGGVIGLASVSARLCVNSSEKARHMGRTFLAEYAEYMYSE